MSQSPATSISHILMLSIKNTVNVLKNLMTVDRVRGGIRVGTRVDGEATLDKLGSSRRS